MPYGPTPASASARPTRTTRRRRSSRAIPPTTATPPRRPKTSTTASPARRPRTLPAGVADGAAAARGVAAGGSSESGREPQPRSATARRSGARRRAMSAGWQRLDRAAPAHRLRRRRRHRRRRDPAAAVVRRHARRAAAAVWLAPRLLTARPAVVAATLFGGTLVLRLALAAGRGGTAQWDRVFDVGRYFEASNEYLPALPALDYGPGFFLDRFAELVPSFPVHVAGHPPGLPLVMGALGLDTPARLAAFCIAVGAM